VTAPSSEAGPDATTATTSRAPAGDHTAPSSPAGGSGRQAPLGAYALLIATYSSATLAALAAAKRRGRLPERPRVDDLLLVAVATQRLSRLVTKDRVATVLRAPFTTYQGEGGPAEVEEAATGTGVRRAVGELLVCPFCVAQWIATGLLCGVLFAPRVTRFAAGIFSSVAIADLLQLVYKGTEKAALD
jgi:hypothetical protein